MVPQEGYAGKMSKPHKVFGIGLNKTGTSSLMRALITLGYNHSDQRGHFTHKYFNYQFDQIFETVENFNSFADWPWPLMYKQVFEKYGKNARYILTRRSSADTWLESLKAHTLATNPDNNPRKRIFGYDYPHGAEAHHIAFYERHLIEVRAYFKTQNASDVLCEIFWEEGDGWRKICGFLNEPMPDANFPHANRRTVPINDSKMLRENERRIAIQVARLNNA